MRCPGSLLVLALVACEAAPSPSPSPDALALPDSRVDLPRPDLLQAEAQRRKLQISVEGTGRVDSAGGEISCPDRCEAQLPSGARVSLSVQPGLGHRLASWSGACTGTGPCELLLDRDLVATARFEQIDPRWDPSVSPADCKAAWGTQGELLSPCDVVRDHYVVVRKSKRNLALCDHGALTTAYPVGLGFAPVGDKVQQGDGKTPEGVFFIAELVPDSTYYKAFLISYPDAADAARGLAAGLIDAAQAAAITKAQAACQAPPQSTKLGGVIELHGNGGSIDWTAGCVAVEDLYLDKLWATLGVGDTIVILP